MKILMVKKENVELVGGFVGGVGKLVCESVWVSEFVCVWVGG